MTEQITTPEPVDSENSNSCEWLEEYKQTLENPPIVNNEGMILTTVDGSDCCLFVEAEEGSVPFMYAKAYVPELVGGSLGWYLHSFDTDKTFGLKCILLPKAREECLKMKGTGGSAGRIGVKALKIVRTAQSKKAVLCEVHEY